MICCLINTLSWNIAGFELSAIENDAGSGDSPPVNDADCSEDEMDQSIPSAEICDAVVTLPQVSLEIQEDFLYKIYEQVAVCFPRLCFAMSRVVVDSKEAPVLTITQRRLCVHAPHGMVPRIQDFVQYKEYSVHVMMRLWRRQSFEGVDDIIALCNAIGEGSQYKFRPGIGPELYIKKYYEIIWFHTKGARRTVFSFRHVDSVKCELLFELSHNVTKEEKDAEEVKCYPCKGLVRNLDHQVKRTLSETPARKLMRQQPSSRARLSGTSPASRTKCKKLAQYDRTNNIRKLAKYEEHEVTLDDD